MDLKEKIEHYLSTLELDKNITIKELKKAYRQQLKVWHPDRFISDKELQSKANDKTVEINTAYKFLKENLDYIIHLEDENITANDNLTNENEDNQNNRKNEQFHKIKFLLLVFLFIVGFFYLINYIKFRESINRPLFGDDDSYVIKKIDSINLNELSKGAPDYDINMHLQSREISSVISKLFQSTELKLYNNIIITGTFISLEYMSGLNPDIEHIVGLETTSYSVESSGADSTMFLWYYSFDFPELNKSEDIKSGIGKDEFLTMIDTTVNDYTLKFFDQFYKTNRIYEPVLIWVRGEEDIKKAGNILNKTDPTVLLRKFVLFNEVDNPDPRAGFYVSFPIKR